MMKDRYMLFLVFFTFTLVCFFPGCAEENGGGTVPEPPASTGAGEPATTQPAAMQEPATRPAGLSPGRYCSADDECASGCCAYEAGNGRCREESFCVLADLNEEECYEKGLFWCIDRCSDKECGDCGRHLRCVDVGGIPRIETALQVEGHKGSCKYSGLYADAGGNESYCDRNEGRLIYGKCGMPPALEDCVAAYGEYCCYTIAQKRSFHSLEGEEYDLWCFSCSKAVEQ